MMMHSTPYRTGGGGTPFRDLTPMTIAALARTMGVATGPGQYILKDVLIQRGVDICNFDKLTDEHGDGAGAVTMNSTVEEKRMEVARWLDTAVNHHGWLVASGDGKRIAVAPPLPDSAGVVCFRNPILDAITQRSATAAGPPQPQPQVLPGGFRDPFQGALPAPAGVRGGGSVASSSSSVPITVPHKTTASSGLTMGGGLSGSHRAAAGPTSAPEVHEADFHDDEVLSPADVGVLIRLMVEAPPKQFKPKSEILASGSERLCIDRSALGQLIANATRLGWIECDPTSSKRIALVDDQRNPLLQSATRQATAEEQARQGEDTYRHEDADTTTARCDAVKKVLGYKFRKPQLLTHACTHKSLIPAQASAEERVTASNERFEFVGDALLGAVISLWICEKFPVIDEGRMSRVRSTLVSRKTLAEAMDRSGLLVHCLVGQTMPADPQRWAESVKANLAEAIIAAVHIDGGGWEAVTAVTLKLLAHVLTDKEQLLGTADESDVRMQLQTLCLQHFKKMPLFMSERVPNTPEHAPIFTAMVQINVGTFFGPGTPGLLRERGEGTGVRRAEAAAAQELLKVLRQRLTN